MEGMETEMNFIDSLNLNFGVSHAQTGSVNKRELIYVFEDTIEPKCKKIVLKNSKNIVLKNLS